jgi:hypothetical protein
MSHEHEAFLDYVKTHLYPYLATTDKTYEQSLYGSLLYAVKGEYAGDPLELAVLFENLAITHLADAKLGSHADAQTAIAILRELARK